MLVQLKNLIDKRHRDALEALKTIAAYLSDPEVIPGGGKDPMGLKPLCDGERTVSEGRATFTAAVLEALQQDYRTVGELAEQLQLDESKIRTVLYAPAVRHRIEIDRDRKPLAFRLKQPGHLRIRPISSDPIPQGMARPISLAAHNSRD